MRLGALCRTVTYGYLAFAMGRLLAERHASSSPRSTSAGVLAEPLGRFVLGAAGLVIIGVGIGLIVFGVRREFLSQLDEEARRTESRRVPIVGSVCMDMIMIDVSGLDASPGDEVVLIGRQGEEEITAREMASAIGSIPWEITCRLGSRIQRKFT